MWRLTKDEKKFSRVMKAKGMKLIPQPYLEKLHTRPDFYCINNDTYYEVISHRDSYLTRAKLIRRTKRRGIKIDVVNPDGTLYEKLKIARLKPRKDISNLSYLMRSCPKELWIKLKKKCDKEDITIRKFILKIIKDYVDNHC